MPGIKKELDFVPRVLKAEILSWASALRSDFGEVLGADVKPHADGHIGLVIHVFTQRKQVRIGFYILIYSINGIEKGLIPLQPQL